MSTNLAISIAIIFGQMILVFSFSFKCEYVRIFCISRCFVIQRKRIFLTTDRVQLNQMWNIPISFRFIIFTMQFILSLSNLTKRFRLYEESINRHMTHSQITRSNHVTSIWQCHSSKEKIDDKMIWNNLNEQIICFQKWHLNMFLFCKMFTHNVFKGKQSQKIHDADLYELYEKSCIREKTI